MIILNSTPLNSLSISGEGGTPPGKRDIINGVFYQIEVYSRFLQEYRTLQTDQIITLNWERDLHGGGSGTLLVSEDIKHVFNQSNFVRVVKNNYREGYKQDIEVLYFAYISEVSDTIKLKSVANLSQLVKLNFAPTDGRKGLRQLLLEIVKSLNLVVRFDDTNSGYPFFVDTADFIGWEGTGIAPTTDINKFSNSSVSDFFKSDFILFNGERRGFLEILASGKLTINEQFNVNEVEPSFTLDVGTIKEKRVMIKEPARFNKKDDPLAKSYNEKFTMTSITKIENVDDLDDIEKVSDLTRDNRFDKIETPYQEQFLDTGIIAELLYNTDSPYKRDIFDKLDQEIVIEDQEYFDSIEGEGGYSVVLHDSTGGIVNIIEASTRDIVFKILPTDTQVFIGLGIDTRITYTGKTQYTSGYLDDLVLEGNVLKIKQVSTGILTAIGIYDSQDGYIKDIKNIPTGFINLSLNNVSFTAGEIRNIQSNTIPCGGQNVVSFSEKIIQKEYDIVMYGSCASISTRVRYGIITKSGEVLLSGYLQGNFDFETMTYTGRHGEISYLEIYNAYPPISQFNLLIEFNKLNSDRSDDIKANTRNIAFLHQITPYFVGFGLDTSKSYTGIWTDTEGNQTTISLVNGIISTNQPISKYNPVTGNFDPILLYYVGAIITIDQVSFSAGQVRNIQSNTIPCGGQNVVSFSEKIIQKEYDIVMYGSCASISTRVRYGIITKSGEVLLSGYLQGNFDFETMTYTGRHGEISYLEIYNAIKPAIWDTLKLDLSEPIPLRDKVKGFGVSYYPIGEVIKDAPLEVIIYIPDGYKITRIEYFINDYRKVAPYWELNYNTRKNKVARLVAELVKYQMRGNTLLSAGTFNNSRDKVF